MNSSNCSTRGTSLAIAGLALLLSGCIAVNIDESEVAAIRASGNASLQPSSHDEGIGAYGPRTRRIFASEIDSSVTKQKARSRAVWSVAPGSRRVSVVAEVNDGKFGGYDLQTAKAELSFEAQPGGRYQVTGKIFSNVAEFWIIDLASNERVSPVVSAPYTTEFVRVKVYVMP
jgi:hypothetical protein